MWYNRIVGDLGKLPEFITHYEQQLEQAKFELGIKGNLEKNLAALPGITEYRFNQLQEIEAVLNYLNIQQRKIRRRHFQKYLEAYQRALTSRDAEKYSDGEDEVINMDVLINEVALIRNKWLGLIKGLESKNYMMGHIAKLRTSGMEDITI